MLLAFTLIAMGAASYGAENKFGLWTFACSSRADQRQAEPLSRRAEDQHGVHPLRTQHLPSHFRTARMNWLFPISITGLSLRRGLLAGRLRRDRPRPTGGFASWAPSPRSPCSSTGSWCCPCRTKNCGAGCCPDVQRQQKPSRQGGSPMDFDKLFQAQLDATEGRRQLSHLRRAATRMRGLSEGPQP
jgi:hypothetical protein